MEPRDTRKLALPPIRGRERRRERGQVLAIVAIGSIALFGAVGLAVDGSLMLQERRHAQAAADQAALAAAYNRCTVDGASANSARQAGLAAAASNGFDDAASNVAVSVEPVGDPATTFNFRAVITSTIDATFARVLGYNTFDVSTEATAAGDGCEATAGGGDLGAIYAGGNTCTTGGSAGIDVSGSQQKVYGGAHTNTDIKVSGSNNTFTETTDPDIDDPVTYKGSILLAGTNNTFQAGYPLDIYPTSPVPAAVWPVGWAPSSVTGGGGTPPTSGSMLRKYYDLADANGTNDANDTLFTTKVNDIDKDGVWYTTSPLGMDISRVDGVRNVVLVAPNGPIKISASKHELHAITNAQIDLMTHIPLALNLPREGVLMLSTMPKTGDARCSEYTISMSGSGHRWSGILWAPTSLIEINGSDNAGVSGSAIGWAVRLNGSDLELRENTGLGATEAEPLIVLLK